MPTAAYEVPALNLHRADGHSLDGARAAAPSLGPTIAPLGSERLIPVRYVRAGNMTVRGAVTGREYHFAAGQAQDVPLVDARRLVSEGDFAFSGGR